jgi:hypothetical protein
LIGGLEVGCQFGLRFERPGAGVERTPSAFLMEGAGDAPPDAMVVCCMVKIEDLFRKLEGTRRLCTQFSKGI